MNPVHISEPNFPRSILILHSYLCLGLPSGLFPSGFPAKILYAFFFYVMRATCPTHVILLGWITPVIFRETYKLWSSSLFSLLKPPTTFSHLGLNSPLSTLFSSTLNLCSSLRVRDKV